MSIVLYILSILGFLLVLAFLPSIIYFIDNKILISPLTYLQVRKTNITPSQLRKLKEYLKDAQTTDLSIHFLLKIHQKGINVFDFIEAYRIIDNLQIKQFDREKLLEVATVKRDLVIFAEILEKAEKANLLYNIDLFVKEKLTNEQFESIVDIMIDSDTSGHKIMQRTLLTYFNKGGDLKKLANAVKINSKNSLNIPNNILLNKHITDDDPESLAQQMLSAKLVGLDVPLSEILKANLSCSKIKAIIKALTKLKKAGLDLPVSDFIGIAELNLEPELLSECIVKARFMNLSLPIAEIVSYHVEGGNIDKLTSALSIAKEASIKVDINELLMLEHNNIDVVVYVKSLILGKILKIEKEKIRNEFLQGKNVLNILAALQNANNANLDLSFEKALLFPDHEIENIVENAISPKLIKSQEVKLIGQDGVEINIPFIEISVKALLDKYLYGGKTDLVINVVQDFVVKEIQSYDKYQDILSNLNIIYASVISKINNINNLVAENKTIKENHSVMAYKIMAINIPVINIGKDTTIGRKQEGIDLATREAIKERIIKGTWTVNDQKKWEAKFNAENYLDDLKDSK